jgi:hypothetical protein
VNSTRPVAHFILFKLTIIPYGDKTKFRIFRNFGADLFGTLIKFDKIPENPPLLNVLGQFGLPTRQTCVFSYTKLRLGSLCQTSAGICGYTYVGTFIVKGSLHRGPHMGAEKVSMSRI